MKLADIRQKYPQYSDLSDTQLADSFHAKFYADMDRKAFNDTIGLGPGSRTWGEVAKDSALSVGQSFANLGADLSWLVDTVTPGDMSAVTKRAEDSAKWYEDHKSAPLKAMYDQLGAADGFVETLKTAKNSPAVIPDILLGSVAYLLPLGAAGRAATGARMGTAAMAAAGGTLEGAGAARQAEQQVASMTLGDLLESSSEYRAQINQGIPPEQAKRNIQNATGLTTFAVTAPLAALASVITGAGRFESRFFKGEGAGNFFAGLARETVEEAAQEASNQFGANVGERAQANDIKPLGEGVAGSAALGAIAGGGQAGAMGAIQLATGRRGPANDPEAVNRIFEAGDVDSAIDAAADGLRPVKPGESRPISAVETIPYRGSGTPTGSRMNAAGEFEVAGIEPAAPLPGAEGFTNDQVDVVPFRSPGAIAAVTTSEPAGSQIPAVDLPTRRLSTGDQTNPAMRLAMQRAASEREAQDRRQAELQTIAGLEALPDQDPGAAFDAAQQEADAQRDSDYQRALAQKAEQDIAAASVEPPPLTPLSSVILRHNGQPFGSEMGAKLSEQFKANPGATIVEVEGGFGVLPVAVEPVLVKQSTDAKNDLQQVQQAPRGQAETAVLQGVPQREHEGVAPIQRRASRMAGAEEGQLPVDVQGVPEARPSAEERLSAVRGREVGNAPPGLRPAEDGDLAVRSMPSGGAQGRTDSAGRMGRGEQGQAGAQPAAQVDNPQALSAGERAAADRLIDSAPVDKEGYARFEASSNTLAIPRAEMPQIKAEHRGALTQYLKGQGLSHTMETVPASSLKPTQAEFSPAKVKQAREYTEGDRSILISSDNHIIDGHHQALAKGGEDISVIRINAPIRKVLDVVKGFPSAEASEGNAPNAQGNAPNATAKSMEVEFNGQRYPVSSVQDAQKKWDQFRQSALKEGGGASDVGGSMPIFEGGKQVAEISYNGRAWDMEGNEIGGTGKASKQKFVPAKTPPNEFKEGDRVQHNDNSAGTVVATSGKMISVKFDGRDSAPRAMMAEVFSPIDSDSSQANRQQPAKLTSNAPVVADSVNKDTADTQDSLGASASSPAPDAPAQSPEAAQIAKYAAVSKTLQQLRSFVRGRYQKDMAATLDPQVVAAWEAKQGGVEAASIPSNAVANAVVAPVQPAESTGNAVVPQDRNAGGAVTPANVPDFASLQKAYNKAKANLDAIGEEPHKPSPESRAFGQKGRAGQSADTLAKYDAEVKAYNSWRAKYSKLKKLEVEASNKWFNAKKGFRETVTPSDDKQVGKNPDGNIVYERKDGSRYVMRHDRKDRPNGYPDFGGDLSVSETTPQADTTPAPVSETTTPTKEAFDKPLAATGLTSYRYKGRYGWIMVGAKDDTDALKEAQRSTDDAVTKDNLQVWDGERYTDASKPEAKESATPKADPATSELTAAVKELTATLKAQNAPKVEEDAAPTGDTLFSQEYEGLHRPPGPDDGAPAHDLTGAGNIYPDDVYSNKAVQYYGAGESYDAETFSIAHSLKGKPNASVTIYRAIPSGLTNAEKINTIESHMRAYQRRGRVPSASNIPGTKSQWYNNAAAERDRLKALPAEDEKQKAVINPGDWVSISRRYAKEHGESALRGEYKIISKTVKAKEIFTNGDSIHEWGYWPNGTVPMDDTITIDGTERATKNSNGNPIASTEEGIRNFWKWFGNSKIVDAQGRPRVVYHGTDKKFTKINMRKGAQNLFWFTSDKASIENGEVAAAGKGVIMEMYAKIENPADWKQYDRLGMYEYKRENLDGAVLSKGDGQFDGFILDPSQVKSVKNKGQFDPTNKSILLSQMEATAGSRGTTIETVRNAVSAAVESLSQQFGIDVEIVQSMPKNVGGSGREKGYFQNGKVYLVADNILNARDAQIVLAHELVGHKGVLSALTTEQMKDIYATIDRLVKMGGKDALSIAAETTRRYSNYEPGSADWNKEFLAIVAERREKSPAIQRLWNQLKAMVRTWLKEHGFNLPISESDLEAIMLNSERYLRESGQAQETGDEVLASEEQDDTGQPLFSKAPQTGTDALINDSNGRPKFFYHGSTSNLREFVDIDDIEKSERGVSSLSFLGTYFTDDRSTASSWGRGNVKTVNLSMKTPYRMTGAEVNKEFDGYINERQHNKEIKKAIAFREKLKSEGFDGIHVDRSADREKHGKKFPLDEWIVFSAKQIVPADDSETLFSQAPQTDTPEFKRWFGKSKVVDADGEPLVVYHGTIGKDFDTFIRDTGTYGTQKKSVNAVGSWFSEGKEQANIFAGAFKTDRVVEGSHVVPVYLSIKKPFKVHDGAHLFKLWQTHGGGNARGQNGDPDKFRAWLKGIGADGLVMDADKIDAFDAGGKFWVALEPTQIKSSISNTGRYSRTNPNILFSQESENTDYQEDDSAGFAVPDETLVTVAIRKMQDKFKVLKDLQANIREAGGTITDQNDTYLAEELFHGKAENDLREMRDQYVEPLAQKMATFGISRAELDQYLYARHARERNKYIASINPKMQDGGSGMKDAEALRILSEVIDSGKLPQYKQVAAIVDDIIAMQRDMIVQGGLEDDGLVTAWQDTYKYYVPLKGWAEDTKDQGKPRTGKGFNIGGKETKRALGRSSKAASPLSFAIVDLTEKIIRKRKNEVGNALLKLIQDNPNPEYWETFDQDNPETDRKISKVAGVEQVTEGPLPMAMLKDRYFTTKVDGKTHYMRLKDERLMRAMKNLGPESNGALLRTLAGINRVLSALNTSYSPEFLISNFARDVQTAVLNLQAEQSLPPGVGRASGKAIAAQTIKDIPKAMRAIYSILRGEKPAGELAEWGDLFEQFRADGAKTGYFDMKDLDGQAADIDKLVQIAEGGWKGNAMKWAAGSAKIVETLNGSVENAVRLAAYTNAIKAGLSRPRAASLAKNMTVNFNRRGELGTTLNALYMFANASIQGTANFVRTMGTLKGDKSLKWSNLNNAQKLAIGITAAAFFLAMANRAGAGDDDDGENWYDKVPDYVKERNIVLMKSLFGGEQNGEYWKIPLPYGFNIFYVLGDNISAAAAGANSPLQSASNVTLAALGSFSPIGYQDSQTVQGMLLKNAAPTVAKPVVELALNENFAGSSIFNENFPFGTPKPDSSLGRRSTPAAYTKIATWLNEVTGGSEFRPGAVDVNPDVMQYVLDYMGGSAYNFFGSKVPDYLYRQMTGVDPEVSQIPFISRIAGRVMPYEDTDTFYTRRDSIQQIEDEYRSLTPAERAQYPREDRQKLLLRGLLKNTENQLQALRKRRDVIYSADISVKERDDRIKEVEVRMKVVVDRFNARYSATE